LHLWYKAQQKCFQNLQYQRSQDYLTGKTELYLRILSVGEHAAIIKRPLPLLFSKEDIQLNYGYFVV